MSLDPSAGDDSPLVAPYVSVFKKDFRLDMSRIEALAEHSSLYVILVVPRSGSTWFCELVDASGGLGTPQEWFNEVFVQGTDTPLGCKPPRVRGLDDINTYVSQIVAEGEGAAGIQLSYWQAEALSELAFGPVPIEKITWFYLRRRDILAQAISLFVSSESGYWHSYQDRLAAGGDVTFDLARCTAKLARLLNVEQKFEEMMTCCGIDPVRLFYEDIQLDPLATLTTFAEVLGRAGPDRLPETKLKQLRTNRTDGWKSDLAASPTVQRLLADRRTIGPAA